MNDRFTRVEYSPYIDAIIASDIVGRVHILDKNLNIVKSSRTSTYNRKIAGFCFDENYVYTRNTFGGIGKFDLKTLLPVDYHDDFSLRNEEWVAENEEASLNNARGIGLHNGKIYTTNGYGQYIKLDAETFDCEYIEKGFSPESFVDCVNSESDEVHAISETCGMLHFGNLETNEFPTKVQVDSGNVHIVKLDKKNNRFIATQDYGLDEDTESESKNGLITIELDASKLKTYYFTTDDVETIEFSPDYNYVYVGGFDGFIYVFENEKELKMVNKIGPFHDQITYVTSTGENDLVVLLQSGELQKIDINGKLLAEYDYPFTCIFAIENVPGSTKNELFLTNGTSIKFAKVNDQPFNSIGLDILKEYKYNLGMIIKVKPLSDYSFIALTRQKILFRVDSQGKLLWTKSLAILPKNLAIDEQANKALVGLDNGDLLEVSLDNGTILRSQSKNSPVYALAYHNNNILSATKEGIFEVIDRDTFEVTKSFDLGSYPKNINVTEDGIFIIGGSFGISELSTDDYSVKKEFVELMVNTKEDGLRVGDFIYVVSFGRQLGCFNYHTGELVHLDETFIDFSYAIKSFKLPSGEEVLVLGGHGGYIYFYRLVDGIPVKVREKYIL